MSGSTVPRPEGLRVMVAPDPIAALACMPEMVYVASAPWVTGLTATLTPTFELTPIW